MCICMARLRLCLANSNQTNRSLPKAASVCPFYFGLLFLPKRGAADPIGSRLLTYAANNIPGIGIFCHGWFAYCCRTPQHALLSRR